MFLYQNYGKHTNKFLTQNITWTWIKCHGKNHWTATFYFKKFLTFHVYWSKGIHNFSTQKHSKCFIFFFEVLPLTLLTKSSSYAASNKSSVKWISFKLYNEIILPLYNVFYNPKKENIRNTKKYICNNNNKLKVMLEW